MSAWIAVTERLPAPNEQVYRYGEVIGRPRGTQKIGFVPHIDIGALVTDKGFRWADWGVTHWMPLPILKAPRCVS